MPRSREHGPPRTPLPVRPAPLPYCAITDPLDLMSRMNDLREASERSMASTSTSEPMSSVAVAPLDALTTHLDILINALVHTNTFAAAPNAASSLVAADDALTSALATLKQHQQNYARILHLREEAQQLEDDLKTIVRKAVRLREDVGRIHPSILDDDAEMSDEEDTEDTPLDQSTGRAVDYNTLLNFAARIGKHNSLAAREAEQEAERRKIDAIRMKEKMASSPAAPVNMANTFPNATNDNADEEPKQDELALQAVGLDESLAAERAKQGLGFPEGMLLRMGELGRLQKLREDAVASGSAEETDIRIRSGVGEDAVEREIERLVRATEDVAAEHDNEIERKVEEEEERAREEQASKRRDEVNKTTAAQARPRRESVSQRPPAAAAPKRKKINLDFGGDDDDDDDDDD